FWICNYVKYACVCPGSPVEIASSSIQVTSDCRASVLAFHDHRKHMANALNLLSWAKNQDYSVGRETLVLPVLQFLFSFSICRNHHSAVAIARRSPDPVTHPNQPRLAPKDLFTQFTAKLRGHAPFQGFEEGAGGGAIV